MVISKVPIVFAFDHNLIFPACVSISSLLSSAKDSTFYDIYILYPEEDACFDVSPFERLQDRFKNYSIHFLPVNLFGGAYEVRGVTKPTYYRLVIPEIIKHYDKVIYADVDIIFRLDLSKIYDVDMSDYYLAATYDLCMNIDEGWRRYVKEELHMEPGRYMQAGFIIMNSKKIREDGLVSVLVGMVEDKYKFQDQDILNIVCAEKIKVLPWEYNMTDYSFYYANRQPELLQNYANSDVQTALNTGNLHYNGHKPWKKYSVNYDIWWEFYRKSPFYDNHYYFEFFYSRLNEHDNLSLWKRIKILVRFFVFGRRKAI